MQNSTIRLFVKVDENNLRDLALRVTIKGLGSKLAAAIADRIQERVFEARVVAEFPDKAEKGDVFVFLTGFHYPEKSRSYFEEFRKFEALSDNTNNFFFLPFAISPLPIEDKQDLPQYRGRLPRMFIAAEVNFELLVDGISFVIRKEVLAGNDVNGSIVEVGRRPVWLCVYNPSKAVSFGSRIITGSKEEWKINPFGHERLSGEMEVGDQVVIWRTESKPRRGQGPTRGSGIVALARVSSLDGLLVSDRKEARIEFEITEAFPDNPFPRKDFLGLLGDVDSSWPQAVSLKRLKQKEEEAFLSLSLPPLPPTSDTEFSSDQPQLENDLLNRAPLAFTLAHKINEMWGEQNKDKLRNNQSERPAFTLHIDAPWGGGKTTFANYVSRFLNPDTYELKPATLKSVEGSIFYEIDMDDPENWPIEFRDRKWITVPFNAWRHQHVSPPWWDLYEVIREECVRPKPWYRRWWLRSGETIWRAFPPQRVRMTAGLVAITAIFFFLLDLPQVQDMLGIAKEAKPGSVGSGESVGVGSSTLVAALLTALTGVSGLAVLTTFGSGILKFIRSTGESIDSTALGDSDPLRRFRKHFAAMVKDAQQPVLVVVDDLDRCDADYVVELVRGMLTVFQSPRVVFMLLGDRTWIETAFSKAYESMKDAHAEDGITFGRRFVEKAIQVSFVLPEPDNERRSNYVDSLLFRGKSASQDKDVAPLGTTFPARGDPLGTVHIQPTSSQSVELDDSDPVDGGIGSNLASDSRIAEVVRAAADRGKLEDDTKHVLSSLKDYLPENPRRIKRIINTITLYQASAMTVFGTQVQSDDWYRLVPWVLLMSEYPTQWRILCEKPHLVDQAKVSPIKLPEDPKHEDYEDLSSLGSKGLAALLNVNVFGGNSVRIDQEHIEKLSKLTPVN